jgi:hypothetical protein
MDLYLHTDGFSIDIYIYIDICMDIYTHTSTYIDIYTEIYIYI